MVERIRGGFSADLSEAERRIVAAWAADCAERVLGLFEAKLQATAVPGMRSPGHVPLPVVSLALRGRSAAVSWPVPLRVR
jgi:hypothetical protein